MSILLRRLGYLCARHPVVTLLVWLALAGTAIGTGQSFGGRLTQGGTLPHTPFQQASDLLATAFPRALDETADVVVQARPGTFAGGPPAVALDNLGAALGRLPHVLVAPEVIRSADDTLALVRITYQGGRTAIGPADAARLERVVGRFRGPVRAYAAGTLVLTNEPPATGRAEKAGFAIAIVVLVLAFGSLVAAGLPLVTAVFGLTIGLALVQLLASGYGVDSSAPALATMIGLGVGIDYALFVITRHREDLAAGADPLEAAANANATAGASVFYAGVTVVGAISGLAVAGIPVVTSLGAATALVVAVAVLAALTLLPALLGLIGARINSGHLIRWPVVHRRPSLDPAAQLPPAPGWWYRWARHVEQRPWRYAIASVAVLVVLALPLAGIRLGQPDAGSAAKGSADLAAYQLITRGFGVGTNSPLLVVLALPAGRHGTRVLATVRAEVSADPGVARLDPTLIAPDGRTAVFDAVARSAPQSGSTFDLVDRLRGPVAAQVAATTGARLLVGGAPAAQRDLATRIQQRLPIFVGVVLLVSFLLLAFVFRSLLVPLKAVVLNVLSIAASYGVLVAVFQWGWLRGLVGLSEPVPIVQVVPMIMFAIVFGLSMDYEVFLLSRVREHWLDSGDARGSVVAGLTATARVITAAALIMVCVFLSFTLSSTVVVKMMGVGLAAAIIVDTTLIRLVLVPATMALLGEANWWLPRWLDRLLPHMAIDGAVPVVPHG